MEPEFEFWVRALGVMVGATVVVGVGTLAAVYRVSRAAIQAIRKA